MDNVSLKGTNQDYTKQQVIDAMDMLSDICHSASVRGGWRHYQEKMSYYFY